MVIKVRQVRQVIHQANHPVPVSGGQGEYLRVVGISSWYLRGMCGETWRFRVKLQQDPISGNHAHASR
jgi:hypothetical protein